MDKKIKPIGKSIKVEYDGDTMDYYTIWEPIVVGAGKTEEEALEDLRIAAHFSVDKLIDLKLKNK